MIFICEGSRMNTWWRRNVVSFLRRLLERCYCVSLSAGELLAEIQRPSCGSWCDASTLTWYHTGLGWISGFSRNRTDGMAPDSTTTPLPPRGKKFCHSILTGYLHSRSWNYDFFFPFLQLFFLMCTGRSKTITRLGNLSAVCPWEIQRVFLMLRLYLWRIH